MFICNRWVFLYINKYMLIVCFIIIIIIIIIIIDPFIK